MEDSTDRAAIEAIVAEQDAAWRAGDAAAFSGRVADDVVFTNVVGMFAIGRAPFEEIHAHIFATFYKGSKLSQSIANIAWIRPDVAIVDTLTEVTGFGALPPGAEAIDGALRTRLEQVMVRNDGVWSVASFHNVPINPRALPGGPPAGID